MSEVGIELAINSAGQKESSETSNGDDGSALIEGKDDAKSADTSTTENHIGVNGIEANSTKTDDSVVRQSICESKSEVVEDRERERSSSPEIVHIKTISENKPTARKSENELKKMFESEYLEKVLFKIHRILTDKESESETAQTEEPKREEEQEAENSELGEPISKKAKLANSGEDSDDEITTLRTIDTHAIPGFTPVLEAKLCDLWDLSSQSQVAQFMFEKQCYESLKDIISKSSGRLREIAIGIVANLSSIPEVCHKVREDTELCDFLFAQFDGELPKPDIQNQALKLFSFCLQYEEQKWVDLLVQHKIVPKCIKFASEGNVYTIEKIMENMGFMFDVSDSLKTSLADESSIVEFVCSAITRYGLPSKEESAVETVGALVTILCHIEATEKLTKLVHAKCELVLETLQTVIVSLDERQFLFNYKQVIPRVLKLAIKLFSKESESLCKLQVVVKFHKIAICAIEFLDLFEQEVEDAEFEIDGGYSMQHNYLVLTECYNVVAFLEQLHSELGEEKFFEAFSEETVEILKSAFDSYSKSNVIEDQDEENGSDVESDSDVMEIQSATTSANPTVAESVSSDAKATSDKSTTETADKNCESAERTEGEEKPDARIELTAADDAAAVEEDAAPDLSDTDL